MDEAQHICKFLMLLIKESDIFFVGEFVVNLCNEHLKRILHEPCRS